MIPKAANNIVDSEDICVWPDQSWCYSYELWEMHWKSDDYMVLRFNTLEYHTFLYAQEIAA
jgi:hypothetical protein